MTNFMTNFSLTLDYDLKAGWLAPFVEGLTKGQAVARRCASCGRVSFPPLRTCSCGSQEGDWVTLSGRAVLKARTRGADGDFGLVAFEGAEGLASVVLDGLEGPEGLDGPVDPRSDLVLRLSTQGTPRLILSPEVASA